MFKHTTMFMKIIKRDGAEVEFSAEKIAQAIGRAGKATGEFDQVEAASLTEQVVAKVTKKFEAEAKSLERDIPRVEEIQDAVEQVLMQSRFKATAKAYILYRAQHAEMRAFATAASLGLVDNYLEKLDWQVKENSNMGYSLQGLNNYIFSEVSKTYWLNKIYPREIRAAYESGDMHIHDLGTLAIYCVGWDLMDLLTEGFRGVADKIESAPPKHFRSALGQIVNFMYTLQGEAAGAIAFSNFDTLLAPFIRYDGLSAAEVKQSMQEFVFNMNVPTRVGFQTPFSNITLDLTPSVNFKNNQVMIGGKLQKEKYGEFQREMDILNAAFFEVMAKGDAAGRVFTFPIPTVNVTKDFDWENPNLAGLWDITINLPRIAYVAKHKGATAAEAKQEFFKTLAEKMDIARDSLEIKRKIVERMTDANLYPYTKFYLRKIKESYGEYWKNHFSTIGLVGMNETALNLIGVNIGTEKGHVFAAEVLDFMRQRLVGYQKATGNLFNLEATPAEGTAYRLALKDKKLFPDIIVANEAEVAQGAQPFYTNSSHVPVNFTEDIVELLNIQDDLQTKYTGGTVIHLFLGERIADPRSVPALVKKICENYHLPYFTLTPTFSVCSTHGYIKGEHRACPTAGCSRECEVYSRVVGYLRPVSQWNEGKQAEYTMRGKFAPEFAGAAVARVTVGTLSIGKHV